MRRQYMLSSLAALLLVCICMPELRGTILQSATPIPPGSKVYINTIDGFDKWLVAGFEKKKVPLVIVTDKEHADFEITGTMQVREPSKWEQLAAIGAAVADQTTAPNVGTQVDVAINVKNLKTGEIVFGYAWHGKRNAQQSAAEACAKNLNKKIEGK